MAGNSRGGEASERGNSASPPRSKNNNDLLGAAVEPKKEGADAGPSATLEVDGVDPGEGLTSTEVNGAVSAVSGIAEVRDVLVAKQRDYQSVGNIVMEGRDIGSVVFPDTPFKFYIDASAEVRAARRRGQGIEDDLASRDAADSGRAASPLVVADDAVVIDTSEMDLGQVVDAVVEGLRARGMGEV